MKLMIASDLHGVASCCRTLFERFEEEKADRLLLLGDLLYHGPRNGVPAGYAPTEVIDLLNEHKQKILCVHGNCDSEVDQMVLEFPIFADYAAVSMDGVDIFATHGHHHGENTPPPLSCDSILLCGHTHVPACVAHDGYHYLNPGSVSLPKEDSPRSYMIFEKGVFLWKELDTGCEYRRWTSVQAL